MIGRPPADTGTAGSGTMRRETAEGKKRAKNRKRERRRKMSKVLDNNETKILGKIGDGDGKRKKMKTIGEAEEMIGELAVHEDLADDINYNS